MQDLQGTVHLCLTGTVSIDSNNVQRASSNVSQCLYSSGSSPGHPHQPYEHSPRPTFPSEPSRRPKDQRYSYERSLYRRQTLTKISPTLTKTYHTSQLETASRYPALDRKRQELATQSQNRSSIMRLDTMELMLRESLAPNRGRYRRLSIKRRKQDGEDITQITNWSPEFCEGWNHHEQ
jgi:hypothetical protein